MLSSILFQDLGEKAGSIESFKDIQPRNDRIDYSLELGGKVEAPGSKVLELVETGGVGMNIEGTNGGEESGLKVRHKMCHILCDNQFFI